LLHAPHQAISIDAGLALMAQGSGHTVVALRDAVVHAGFAWLLVAPVSTFLFYKMLAPVFDRAAARFTGRRLGDP
jgi:hypothetical protein